MYTFDKLRTQNGKGNMVILGFDWYSMDNWAGFEFWLTNGEACGGVSVNVNGDYLFIYSLFYY